VQLYPSEKPVSSLRVWKGEAKDVARGFVADKYVTLPKGKAEKLQLTMTATEPLLAPVTKGQPVGSVKISLEGSRVAEFPLVRSPTCRRPTCSAAHGIPLRLWFQVTGESMIVYLNGEFLPIEEAKVSVLDRGFIYGDGVYELVPVYARKSFGCPSTSPAAAQPRRHPPRQPAHRAAMDVDHRRAHRAPAVREPGRLLPGHARRREARSHVSEGRSPDGVHDEQSARDSVRRADRAGRRRRHCRGQSLAARAISRRSRSSATC
jgi:hypothetical protein